MSCKSPLSFNLRTLLAQYRWIRILHVLTEKIRLITQMIMFFKYLIWISWRKKKQKHAIHSRLRSDNWVEIISNLAAAENLLCTETSRQPRLSKEQLSTIQYGVVGVVWCAGFSRSNSRDSRILTTLEFYTKQALLFQNVIVCFFFSTFTH